jgi:hypothetical protein
MKKYNKYPDMKCNKIVNCPCYKGDGYTYRFDSIEFNFCDVCNNKLVKQMVEQKMLEIDLIEDSADLQDKTK